VSHWTRETHQEKWFTSTDTHCHAWQDYYFPTVSDSHVNMYTSSTKKTTEGKGRRCGEKTSNWTTRKGYTRSTHKDQTQTSNKSRDRESNSIHLFSPFSSLTCSTLVLLTFYHKRTETYWSSSVGAENTNNTPEVRMKRGMKNNG